MRRASDRHVSDLIVAFLDHRERLVAAGEREPVTILGPVVNLDVCAATPHGAKLHGDIPVSRFKPSDLTRFVRECQRPGFAPRYIRAIVVSVQALMNWAARPIPGRGAG